MAIEKVKRDGLIEWIKAVYPDRAAIWLDPRAPRPPVPYVGLKIIAGPLKMGRDDFRSRPALNPDEVVYSRAGLRVYTLSVNCYGEDANRAADNLSSSIEQQRIVDVMQRNGIGTIATSEVRVLDQLLETDVEGRAQFDLRFAIARNLDEDEVTTIRKVEVTGNGPDGETNVIELD